MVYVTLVESSKNDHDQNVVFTPVLRIKDVAYALRFCRGPGIMSPFGDLAVEHLQQVIDIWASRREREQIIDVLT